MAVRLGGFKDWWRTLRSEPTFRNFFLPLGTSFSYNSISDRQAVELGYMSNLNIYAIVKKAAEGVAFLPFGLYEERNGELIEITEGQVYDLVFYPNQDQTLAEYLEAQMAFYFLNGEAYFIAPSEIGFMPERLIGTPPELMKIVLENQNDLLSEVRSYQFTNRGSVQKFMPHEVMHLRMFNPSVDSMLYRNGLSPLQAAWNKLEASNNQATAQAWYFKNRGVSNLISGEGGSTGLVLTEKDRKAVEEATRQDLGGAHRANSVITIGSPARVQQLGAAASDMQMIEQGSQLLRELCTAYFMPSEMFNDPENKTHANREEAVKTLYNDVFIPNAKRFLYGYKRKFLSRWGQMDGKKYLIKIKTAEIEALNPSPQEIRLQAREDVKAGIITPNEARQEIGYEPLTGEQYDTAKPITSRGETTNNQEQ